MAGIPSNAEILIGECYQAGVLFRRPAAGRLNPILTKSDPSPDLLKRVREHREEIVIHLEKLFASLDEMSADAQAECSERGGECGAPDLCPWFYECQTKKEKNANKC